MIKLRSTRITEDEPCGHRIIRGELEPSSLIDLTYDWYQRGRISNAKLMKLMRGVKEGSEFPDITVGMRGHNFSQMDNSTSLDLHDPCYVIDGMQRVTAHLMVMEDNPEVPIRLGAKIFLDSDVNFENRLFIKMNTGHTAVAACVILRNEKEHSRLAATLYGLTVTEKEFALHKRVCWTQEVDRSVGGQLVRGNLLLRVMAQLHAHVIRGPGLMNNVMQLLTSCERRIDIVGLNQARVNLINFYDAIDEIWGIRQAPIKYGTIYLMDAWTMIMARIFSDHREFWHENELFVSRDAIRDFRKINPNDPELSALARGNNVQHQLLYRMMIDLLNKGKTASHRYVHRDTLEKAEAAAGRARYTDEDHAHA